MEFEIAVQALADAEVDFIIIGGLSANIHGSAHLTNDLDVFISREPENLKRIIRALAPFHPRLRDFPAELPFAWDVATLRNGTVFTLSTDLGKIDLLAEVPGIGSYKEVKAASILVQGFDRTVRTLHLSDLIASKKAAGRPKDIAVVTELEGLLD